jgi:ribosomal peptide maturation radical SAM protein 1
MNQSTDASPAMTVALVNMPFAAADMPSIQCGLLKAVLAGADHPVDVHYLNLELAAELGPELYDTLAHLPKRLLLGEWLFAVAAFGPRPNETEYRASCNMPLLEGTCASLGLGFDRLCELRDRIFPDWIERQAGAVDWGRYGAVGFTSMFEQNTAAFALARAIKERHPRVVILFGGSNFDGDMGKEFVRTMPFIDFAVSGEGDITLPLLLQRLAAGESALDVPGVFGRQDGKVAGGAGGGRVERLDDLPDPDYDEYFAALSRLGEKRVLGNRPPILVVETARGCWWGEKQHCTFCGFNRSSIRFRSRSGRSALDQFRRMSARYKVRAFDAVDNVMDYRYFDDLWGPLAEQHFDYRFFYEVKSNLTPAQLRLLRRGGVTIIQPGIESLSSGLLSLMRKGVNALQNIRFLKWAYYYGMQVHWNLLAGFPGETPEHYEEQLRLLPLIRHLPPPHGGERIWIQRFSPYFTDPSFPVTDLRPFPVYGHIYPEGVDLEEIAYFFECDMGSTLPTKDYGPLFLALEDWKAAWNRRPRPELLYQRSPDWIQLIDRRQEEIGVHAFGEVEAEVYERCAETGATLPAVCKHLTDRGLAVGSQEVQRCLGDFCDLGLMFEEKGRFLSLALPANGNW